MTLVSMSRGPTRKVRRLHASGAVTLDILRAADHEADLLGHPYIGLEHLELARLRLTGLDHERRMLLQHIPVGVTLRWWHPRGPRSALRRRGGAQTVHAQRQAQERDERNAPPDKPAS
jgi:hypothetical protein